MVSLLLMMSVDRPRSRLTEVSFEEGPAADVAAC